MFRKSRIQLLKDALVCFLCGGVVLLLIASGGAWSSAGTCAGPFFGAGMLFLVWRHFKGVANRKRVQRRVQAADAPISHVSPAKASPESSSLELPGLD